MSIRTVIASALGNSFIMLTIALLAISMLGQPFLWLLRLILETLNGL
jgi:hypothetical protein